MLEKIKELIESESKYEIYFGLTSGERKIYYSSSTDLEINEKYISFSDSSNTIIINSCNVESIELNPIY